GPLGAGVVGMGSATVYRGRGIGAGEPPRPELAGVRHHLVDVVPPSHTLTVSEFQSMARAAVADILARGRLPLLVGGSGLYFRAVVDPLEFPGTDPVVRGRLEREAVEQGAMALYERLEA